MFAVSAPAPPEDLGVGFVIFAVIVGCLIGGGIGYLILRLLSGRIAPAPAPAPPPSVQRVEEMFDPGLVATMRAEHGERFDLVMGALNSRDLIPPWCNESWGDPDFYDNEAARILAELPAMRDEAEVRALLERVMEQGFGGVARLTTASHYADVSHALWAVRGDMLR